MESSNIVKVDSKGRILLPVQFRDNMGVAEGTEMIIVPDEDGGHFKILPISKDATAELRLLLGDMPASLALVADALAANSFDILVSESRNMGNGLTEWRIVVDTADQKSGVEALKDVVSNIEGVKSLDVVRK